jgi:hypothetical protein
MAHHTRSRIVPENAANAPCRGLGSVAADHHAGILGKSHADTAAVVD